MLDQGGFDDPRDGWGHARRLDVVRHAHRLGHVDIVETMPKTVMVKLLKARNVPPPPVPMRTLDNPRAGDTTPNYDLPRNGARVQPVVNEVDAEDDALAQWKAQQQAPALKPVAQMNITEVRQHLKRLGIKFSRRDNMAALRALAESHGKQNAA